VNQSFGFGFTPNGPVEIYAGRFAGSTLTACGAIVGIQQATQIAVTQADAHGRIEFDLHLPIGLAGRSGLGQAVDLSTCMVGEVRSQLLQ